MSDHYETRCPSCGGSDEQGCYADCPTHHITALEARVRELEGKLKAITTDLPYVHGWNDGFEHALTETIRLSFPTMLRKMWSGYEIEKWLNERKEEARAALNQEKQK